MNAKTSKPSETHVKDYKRWLMEAEKLRGENGVAVFHRVTLLVKIYEDAEFREEVLYRLDERSIRGIMDDLIRDLSRTFNDFREMLKHFPEQQKWADGNFDAMHDTIAETKVIETGPEAPVRKRKAATLKEVEQVTKSRDLFRTQLSQADQQVKVLREENERLRLEVRELKTKLAMMGEPVAA